VIGAREQNPPAKRFRLNAGDILRLQVCYNGKSHKKSPIFKVLCCSILYPDKVRFTPAGVVDNYFSL
jgi:hypothetical protein